MVRRIESSLVRQDPVMLHEPARTHLRSVLVGLIIAALGAGAFFVVGLFAGDDDLDDSDIVVGKDSGAMYVVEHRADLPLRLIPVPNLASARLLAAGLDSAGQGAADVDLVEDSSLEDAPRGPMTGIESAPGYLPGPKRQIPATWTLCEDGGSADGAAGATTVLGGVPNPGRVLTPQEALLVRDTTGQTWMVWNGRRSSVNLNDTFVSSAYLLAGVEPRDVSSTFLNAIPEAPPLAAPAVPGRGTRADFTGMPNVLVGDIVHVDIGDEEYYLIWRDGKQPIPEGPVLAVVGLESPKDVLLSTIRAVRPSTEAADLSHLPVTVPRYVDTTEGPVACLGWRTVDGKPVTTISVSDTVPVPSEQTPVPLPGADGPAGNLDFAYVPPADGAFVRSVGTGQDLDSGQLFLVTDQGIRYPIPDMTVAKNLGLGGKPRPAPNEIVRLLPQGPALDPKGAVRIYEMDGGQPGK